MKLTKGENSVKELQMEATAQHELVVAVVTHLNRGDITDAMACFADEIRFTDRGLQLQFTNRRRLSEFFRKTRELYPDSLMQTDRILVSGVYLASQWTIRTTVTEPFYGGLPHTVPITVHGVSIVRTKDGRITEWTDYYDGPSSRRTALGAYFEEWVEL
jgi:ketosteroid isomerase-like protein